MKRTHFWRLLAVLLLLVGCGVGLYLSQLPTLWQPGIWHFNFAPVLAEPVPGFTTIHAASDYIPQKGHGWLDASGNLQTGTWPASNDVSWAMRDNVTLLERNSPDDLARTLTSGPATFALDLEPGRYQVWVLSGDAGHWEYTPQQAYRILVEGEEAYRFELDAEQYHHALETAPLHDDLSSQGLWQHYVVPRFSWSRVDVDVSDGQLTVEIQGTPRDHSKSSLAGDYPYTEAGRGPGKTYSGALNAMIVVPQRTRR